MSPHKIQWLKLFAVLLLVASCEKDNQKPKSVPTVKTGEVTAISSIGASFSGEVTSDGRASATERGFVLGQAANPDLSGTRVTAGSGLGTFTGSLTSLAPGITYHLRAYAVNQVGVGYGEDRQFSTSVAIPTVSTTAVGTITTTSVAAGGNVTADGGSAITARGVCWNTTGNPVVGDNKTTDGTGIGAFPSVITGLNSNTKVYVRAYATNSAGTGYGEQLEATTKSLVPLSGLIAYWPFNGNANDVSGNSNNGTPNGVTLTADRFGKSSAAYDFSGAGTNILVSGSSSFNSLELGGSVTVSAWINLRKNGLFPVVNKYKPSTDGGWELIAWQSGINFHHENGSILNASCVPTLNIGQWYHLIFTFDKTSGNYAFYLNGAQVCSGVSPVTLVSTDNGNFYLGYSPNGPDEYADGLIDDVAIWNRALTADEVLKVYNGNGF